MRKFATLATVAAFYVTDTVEPSEQNLEAPDRWVASFYIIWSK